MTVNRSWRKDFNYSTGYRPGNYTCQSLDMFKHDERATFYQKFVTCLAYLYGVSKVIFPKNQGYSPMIGRSFPKERRS